MDTTETEREYDLGATLPERQTYSIRQFSSLTGLSPTAVRRGIRANDLPVKPVRIGGQWMFPRRPVDRLVGLVDD